MEFDYEAVFSDRKTVSLIGECDRSIIVRVPIGTLEVDIKKISVRSG
jgi:hypothetical protein